MLSWWVALGAAAVLLALLATLYRRRLGTLAGRVGSFDCGLRPDPGHGEPVAGIAQYGVGRLYWWRTASLSPRPKETWDRVELEVVRRVDDPHRPDKVLVLCRHGDAEFELSLTAQACAGLVSWLEAAPANTDRVW